MLEKSLRICTISPLESELWTQPYRVKILHARAAEGFCNFFGCHHTGHGVTIAHWLPHGDNVWNEVFTVHLKAPEMLPNSAKAHLNFVSNEHGPCSADVSRKQRSRLMPSDHRVSPELPKETIEDREVLTQSLCLCYKYSRTQNLGETLQGNYMISRWDLPHTAQMYATQGKLYCNISPGKRVGQVAITGLIFTCLLISKA